MAFPTSGGRSLALRQPARGVTPPGPFLGFATLIASRSHHRRWIPIWFSMNLPALRQMIRPIYVEQKGIAEPDRTCPARLTIPALRGTLRSVFVVLSRLPAQAVSCRPQVGNLPHG